MSSPNPHGRIHEYIASLISLPRREANKGKKEDRLLLVWSLIIVLLADCSVGWRSWIGGFPNNPKTNHVKESIQKIWQGVWFIFVVGGCDRERLLQWTEDLRRIGGFLPGGGHWTPLPPKWHTPETFTFTFTGHPSLTNHTWDFHFWRLPCSLYEVAWKVETPLSYTWEVRLSINFHEQVLGVWIQSVQ